SGDELVAERLERLHHRLERESGTDLVRMPRIGKHAVGHVDRAEAERRGRSAARLRGKRRHHRTQEGQRHGCAESTLQERAAGQVLLRDEHGYCALATLFEVSDGSSVVRIWNGTLLTMPVMRSEEHTSA